MQIRHKNGVQIKSNGQKVMAQTKNIPDYPALFFVFLAIASEKGENFPRHHLVPSDVVLLRRAMLVDVMRQLLC